MQNHIPIDIANIWIAHCGSKETCTCTSCKDYVNPYNFAYIKTDTSDPDIGVKNTRIVCQRCYTLLTSGAELLLLQITQLSLNSHGRNRYKIESSSPKKNKRIEDLIYSDKRSRMDCD